MAGFRPGGRSRRARRPERTRAPSETSPGTWRSRERCASHGWAAAMSSIDAPSGSASSRSSANRAPESHGSSIRRSASATVSHSSNVGSSVPCWGAQSHSEHQASISVRSREVADRGSWSTVRIGSSPNRSPASGVSAPQTSMCWRVAFQNRSTSTADSAHSSSTRRGEQREAVELATGRRLVDLLAPLLDRLDPAGVELLDLLRVGGGAPALARNEEMVDAGRFPKRRLVIAMAVGAVAVLAGPRGRA